MAGTGLSRSCRIIKAVDFLKSQKLSLALRLFLGVIILLSAIPKLANIEQNSIYLIYSYYVLPIQPVNLARLMGLTIPYIELLIGLGLVFGVLTRLSAAGWIVVSLAYAIIKLDVIFIQGRVIPCGCFPGIFTNLLVTQSLWLDVFGILAGVQIVFSNREKRLLSFWSVLPGRWRDSRLRYLW